MKLLLPPILELFAFEHLPPKLREVSQPFGELARRIAETLPDNDERNVALRKLLEGKDAAVRARLSKGPHRGDRVNVLIEAYRGARIPATIVDVDHGRGLYAVIADAWRFRTPPMLVAFDEVEPLDADAVVTEAYERLAPLGQCDALGSAEYVRVRDEWVEAGRPPDVDAFVRRRANLLAPRFRRGAGDAALSRSTSSGLRDRCATGALSDLDGHARWDGRHVPELTDTWFDWVKIGWTREDVIERFVDVTCGLPFEFECRLLGSIAGGSREESRLHRRFRMHRTRSEWFQLSSIRAEIDALISVGAVPAPTCSECSGPTRSWGAARCRACAMRPGPGRFCVDCGVKKGRARHARCRACARRREAERQRRVTAALHDEIARCGGCSAPISKKTLEKRGAAKHRGLCRSCAMRVAWADTSYRASIMVARASRRKRCLRCGTAEPRLGSGAKYHPDCWRAVLAERGEQGR